MFDKDVGVNWHLRFRLKIEELEKDNEQLKLKNKILTRKIKNYEDNNVAYQLRQQSFLKVMVHLILIMNTLQL